MMRDTFSIFVCTAKRSSCLLARLSAVPLRRQLAVLAKRPKVAGPVPIAVDHIQQNGVQGECSSTGGPRDRCTNSFPSLQPDWSQDLVQCLRTPVEQSKVGCCSSSGSKRSSYQADNRRIGCVQAICSELDPRFCNITVARCHRLVI